MFIFVDSKCLRILTIEGITCLDIQSIPYPPSEVTFWEVRTYAPLRFAGLVGDYMLNILDFIGRLISFFPTAILCKIRHRQERQGVKIPPTSSPNKD